MGRNNWGSVSFLCNIKHKYVHKDRHIYIQIDWLKVTKLIGQRRLLGGKGGTKQEQAKNMKLEGRSDSSQVVNGGEWLYIQFMLASGPLYKYILYLKIQIYSKIYLWVEKNVTLIFLFYFSLWWKLFGSKHNPCLIPGNPFEMEILHPTILCLKSNF